MEADKPQSLADQYPGGCYLGFNAAIDRPAAQQLLSVCQSMRNNTGSVQSCGNLPFLAGAERYGADGCTFFFHQSAFDNPPGQRLTERVLEERLRWLRLEDERTANIYASRTGRAIDVVRKWMTDELVMSAGAAIENGLICSTRSAEVPPNAIFHQVIV
jgi:ATP-dependent protease ClpP protease subunit